MRRIAIVSKGNTLDSEVNECFGKTKHVAIIYWDGRIKQHDTHYVIQDNSCIGPGLASDLAKEYRVEAVITGHIGCSAYAVFERKGIDVYLPKDNRTVKETVDDYFNNSLELLEEANSPGGSRCSGNCNHSCKLK
ncbi:hypothetical protein D6777_01205 [Candidatus Woesearchaeota archaeon]|nr:MAG: hypothetical protein D6777_01205 [Candidatus Woesearchaeota archaeon]